jgi:hypothetical protein
LFNNKFQPNMDLELLDDLGHIKMCAYIVGNYNCYHPKMAVTHLLKIEISNFLSTHRIALILL